MDNSPPVLASILILHWNNSRDLIRCLKEISLQTIQNFEVVIVNNGSRDALPLKFVENYPNLDLKIKNLISNLGFASANNIGARLARGKWLALLNADAFPEPDWLEKMLEAADEHPEYSCFSSRQIQANNPELLDGTGDAYHISGLAWRNNYNLPSLKNGLRVEGSFSSCAAAALYSHEEFLEAGGFDEDYFSYFEDVDLGFRLRLAGKKCLYVPEAIVHHVGSASTGKRSDFSVYYGYRNMIWTFFKNMPSPLIWYFLPVHIATVSFFVVYLSLRGQGKVIMKAIIDAIRGLPKVMKKRKVIQRNRKIKASDLLKVMSTGLLEPYREFIQRNRTT